MPRYQFTAKTLEGRPHTGMIEAEDEYELARILRKEGYVLISATAEGKAKKRRSLRSLIPFLGSVSLTDKVMFTRNLQVMISAGVALPRALETLVNQTDKKKFRRILKEVAEELTRGQNFFKALSNYPDVFSDLFLNMIKVGEEAGTLEDVLKVLTRQMEREYELKSKVKGAMVYPTVIVSFMVIIGILMMIIVVPRLSKTFEDLNIELPFTTKIVIGTGNFLANFWYLLPFILIGAIVLIKAVMSTKLGTLAFDKLVLKIPVLSGIIKKTNSASTTRTLGSLVEAGIPIVRALEITAGVLGNIYYKKAILEASDRINKGVKFSSVIKDYQKLYSDLMVQMVAVGEETGEISFMFQKLADFYESEVNRITQNLSSIIEPVLMIIIGAAVGFFAVSMLQPIYGMMNAF